MLNDARTHSAQAPGTIAPNDSRILNAYFSHDARNYAFQVPASMLDVDNIGLPGSVQDASRRYWVIVSFGNFDPSQIANIPAGVPGVPGATNPVQIATVAYVILDAQTGQYQGEEFKVPGCAAA